MKTERTTSIKLSRYQSPAGELILGSWDAELCMCDWATERRLHMQVPRICRQLRAQTEPGTSAVIESAAAELDEYFAGRRREFSVPVVLAGTAFQRQVWEELLKIPYGETATYADIAVRIGNPKAVRAVATAIGANPISIFVPCHRVVGSDGTLTGYAGGLPAKRYLLTLEKNS